MIKQLNGSLKYASVFEKAAVALIAMFRNIPGSEDVVGFLFTPEEQVMLDENPQTWNQNAAKLLKEKLKYPVCDDFCCMLSEAYKGAPRMADLRVIGALAAGEYVVAVDIASSPNCVY